MTQNSRHCEEGRKPNRSGGHRYVATRITWNENALPNGRASAPLSHFEQSRHRGPNQPTGLLYNLLPFEDKSYFNSNPDVLLQIHLQEMTDDPIA
jgi:hypothetical protein